MNLEGYSMRKLPTLNYEKSLRYATDKISEKHSIGIQSLLYNHRTEPETWDALISIFRNRRSEDTDPFLIYVLSIIPQCPDIAWDESNIIPEKLRESIRNRISRFTKDDVIKLLSFVNEDEFERGTVGQCVESIISIIDGNKAILEKIAKDKRLHFELRKHAITLLS